MPAVTIEEQIEIFNRQLEGSPERGRHREHPFTFVIEISWILPKGIVHKRCNFFTIEEVNFTKFTITGTTKKGKFEIDSVFADNDCSVLGVRDERRLAVILRERIQEKVKPFFVKPIGTGRIVLQPTIIEY